MFKTSAESLSEGEKLVQSYNESLETVRKLRVSYMDKNGSVIVTTWMHIEYRKRIF